MTQFQNFYDVNNMFYNVDVSYYGDLPMMMLSCMCIIAVQTIIHCRDLVSPWLLVTSSFRYCPASGIVQLPDRPASGIVHFQVCRNLTSVTARFHVFFRDPVQEFSFFSRVLVENTEKKMV